MIFGPLQDLTVLLIPGKPSFTQWVLAFAFTASALCFGGYVAGLWRETLRNRRRLMTSSGIPPNGPTEKPDTSPSEHRIVNPALARKAGISAGALLLTFTGGCLAGKQMYYSRDRAEWERQRIEYQKSYAVWLARQPKEKPVNVSQLSAE